LFPSHIKTGPVDDRPYFYGVGMRVRTSRFDKLAGSEFERTQCGPQGEAHLK